MRALLFIGLQVLACLVACSAPEPAYGPSSVGAIRLTELGGVSPEVSAAVPVVVAGLTRDGEVPSEFYAVVREARGQLEFALWHFSAFLPENRDLIGNPGGKCRTFYYDSTTSRVVRKELWQ